MNTLNKFLIYTSQKFGDLEAYAWAQGDDIVSRTYAEFRNDAAKTADFITKSFGTRKKNRPDRRHLLLMGLRLLRDHVRL